jgi:hypothetical protein
MYSFCISQCYQLVACTSTEVYILHNTNFAHVRRNCCIRTLVCCNRALCIVLVLLRMLYSSELVNMYRRNCCLSLTDNTSTATVYRQVSSLCVS